MVIFNLHDITVHLPLDLGLLKIHHLIILYRDNENCPQFTFTVSAQEVRTDISPAARANETVMVMRVYSGGAITGSAPGLYCIHC